jgi:HK97 family phage portal protein
LEENATALASFHWVAKNFLQGELRVLRRNGAGAFSPVFGHPLEEILSRPNGYEDGQRFLWTLLLHLLSDGNAYLGVERDAEGNLVELCCLPPSRVSMGKETGSREPFDFWEYRGANGLPLRVERADIKHLRFGVDPKDLRLGFAPFRALKRQQYTLDQASNYTANLLRNFGVPGGMITPKDPSVTIDPQEVLDKWNAKTRGDQVGSWMVWDVPLEAQVLSATPQDLALNEMLDRPEADICAAFGVPPQVIGVHCGRLSKTFANLKEAREVAWEETILPLQKIVGAQLGRLLLPEVSPYGERERVVFDVSEARPLQPDRDALHGRAREDWKANLIDRAEWKRLVGLKPSLEDVGVYFCDVGGGEGSEVGA